jgi:hypothetical protein
VFVVRTIDSGNKKAPSGLTAQLVTRRLLAVLKKMAQLKNVQGVHAF